MHYVVFYCRGQAIPRLKDYSLNLWLVFDKTGAEVSQKVSANFITNLELKKKYVGLSFYCKTRKK